jgi:hypothetical protein
MLTCKAQQKCSDKKVGAACLMVKFEMTNELFSMFLQSETTLSS